jgi:uncharacterized membrane protein YfhO
VFTSDGNVFGKNLDSTTDGAIAHDMMLVNSKYLVAVNDELKDKMYRSAIFKEEYSNNRFSVFSVNNYTSEWLSYDDDFDYRMVSFDDNLVLFSYNSTSPKEVLVKVTYHPYWRAFVDNQEIDIGVSTDNLMVLELAPGRHDVLLSYQPFRPLYLIVTLITLTGCVLVLFLRD